MVGLYQDAHHTLRNSSTKRRPPSPKYEDDDDSSRDDLPYTQALETQLSDVAEEDEEEEEDRKPAAREDPEEEDDDEYDTKSKDTFEEPNDEAVGVISDLIQFYAERCSKVASIGLITSALFATFTLLTP